MSEKRYELTRRNALKKGALATGAVVIGGTGITAAGIGDGRVLDFHLNNVNYDREKGDIVAGHVTDASPEDNDGIWYDPEVDPVVDGPVGNAYEFKGGEFIRVEDDSSLQLDGLFTAAGWVKFSESSSSPNDYEFFLSKRGEDSKDEYQAYYAKDQGLLKYYSGSEIFSIDLNLDSGKWHHLAWVFDGDEFIGYHDGSEVGRTSAEAPQAGSNPLFVGQDNVGNYVKAKNDEIRLYDRVLSVEEVTDLATMDEE